MLFSIFRYRLSLALIFLLTSCCWAQPITGINYDESKVPETQVIDPLTMSDARAVNRENHRWDARRSEILTLFQEQVYGFVPKGITVTSQLKLDGGKPVFAGRATRFLGTLTLTCEQRELVLNLLLYKPSGQQTFPVLLGMNFNGNQSIIEDPEIPLSTSWVEKNPSIGIHANSATEESRGKRSQRWPVEDIVSRGYGLCTLHYGDVDPDFDDGFQNGAHGLLGLSENWGTIAAWAWGLSQVRASLQNQEWVDRVGVFGHSRLGKAALWAGATDPEFSFVISNNSGCGGAALSKRKFGETLKAINESFPHWFIAEFHKYSGREEDLPLDQHLLLAAMAPRLLYVTSASEDLWADPKGELLATVFADPAFKELGGKVAYHLRPGKHDMLLYDWQRILDFADENWR